MSFTCNSCGLAFEEATVQRAHMKSDWHRYNLKRRVADLPAIDENAFNTKVAALKIEDSNSKLSKRDERRKRKEEIQEQKRQLLETARRALLASHKVSGNVVKPAEEVTENEEKVQPELQQDEPPQQTEEPTEEQQHEQLLQEKLSNKVEIPVTTCLFCHPKENADFATIDQNIEHMFSKHGLYIPEQKYLVDKEGLLKYLGEKIGLGNVCLCCSYQGKNIEAVREHMKIKRHMRITYETEDEKLEISEFYDFSSTYEDVAQPDDNNEDWEDVSDDGEADDEDDLPPAEQGAIYQNGHELILPTGKVLGHRSMARYYRQNLAPEKVLTEGQGTVIAAENRHLLTVRDKQESAVQKRAWAREIKRADINDRRAAKHLNFQPHFRDQLLQ